jgi:predicted NUDIX family phosphoesterase
MTTDMVSPLKSMFVYRGVPISVGVGVPSRRSMRREYSRKSPAQPQHSASMLSCLTSAPPFVRLQPARARSASVISAARTCILKNSRYKGGSKIIEMGVFLKAAYEVLRAAQVPLSAVEITLLAEKQKLLSSAGKTPSQTMKSKLSTNILRQRDRSIFMRVDKGKFALREWEKTYPEHIADRYQKALFDEKILVFPAQSLRRYIPGVGLYAGEFDKAALLNECRPMQRRLAEEDFSVVQLVSVFIIRHRDRYLTYKRTKRLPESRLHGVYSIGFGGHLNPSDLKPLLNIFDPAVGAPLLERELREEINFKSLRSPAIEYRGLLYDDSREVSKQHLGLTYQVLSDSETFEIGERGFLMDAKYETLEEIQRRSNEFENWSLLILNEELKCREQARILESIR